MGNKNGKVFDSLNKELESKTESIDSNDLNLLKNIGLQINDLIGSGEVGSVYRGVYCSQSSAGIRDTEGHLLNIEYNEEFALKYIDIKQSEENQIRIARIERMQRIRKFIEKEKQMRQKLIHSDLLRIRNYINLGDYQIICLNTQPFRPLLLEDIEVGPSFDRSKALSVRQIEAKLWCKRLLSALNYLHESNVFDVNIKPQNILMFEENIDSESETYVVPKLTDFWVNDYFSDQDHYYDKHSSSSDEESSEERISDKDMHQMTDIYLLANIFNTFVSKTEFKSECNRVLALDLIESMKNFSNRYCDQYLKHQWFGSQEV